MSTGLKKCSRNSGWLSDRIEFIRTAVKSFTAAGYQRLAVHLHINLSGPTQTQRFKRNNIYYDCLNIVSGC